MRSKCVVFICKPTWVISDFLSLTTILPWKRVSHWTRCLPFKLGWATAEILRYAWLYSPVLQLWMCTTMLALSHGCWGIHIHIQFPSCLQRKYWDHLSCLQSLRFLSFSRLNNVSFYTYMQHIVFIPLLFSGHLGYFCILTATINPGAQKHL